jgi:TonB family protein
MERAVQSAFASRPSALGRWLALSLGLHVALVGGILALRALSPSPVLKLDQEPIKASLVRLGKPRDQKLLPRKEELPPPPPAEKPAPPTPAPLEPPPPSPKSAPSLEKEVPTARSPARDKAPPDESRKKLLGAFDKLSRSPRAEPEEAEGALDGDVDGDAARQEGDRYLGLVTARVKRHYDVSETISPDKRLSLRAEVFIRISRTGDVMDAKLVRASGNDLFDAAVIAAVQRASPLPPPPALLVNEFQRQGVTMVFKP